MHITVPQSNTIRAILATSFGYFRESVVAEVRIGAIVPLPTQTRWTERFLQRCVCTVLVAEKASIVREDILMCTGSSFQKRSN